MIAVALLLQIFVFPHLQRRIRPILDHSILDTLLYTATNLTITSIIFFLSRVTELPVYITYSLWTLGAFAYLISRAKPFPDLRSSKDYSPEPNSRPAFQVFGLAFFAISLTIFLFYHDNYGGWDAIAVWNHKAHFLLSDTDWKSMFSQINYWSHPDYPLMLPSLIASSWMASDSLSPFFPALWQVLFWGLICGVLFYGLRQKKNSYYALASLLILSLDRHFIARVVSEYADTLLALYYLIGVLFLVYWDKLTNRQTWVVIGVLLSSCFWIKNEGIVFFALWSIIALYRLRKDILAILYYLLGVSPTLLCFLYLKIRLAPNNAILEAQNNSTLIENLLEPGRYIDILSESMETTISYYPVFILLLLISIWHLIANKRILNWSIIVLICGTWLGYMFAYLVTPYDLIWHLQNSVVRLLHQLWPATLFVLLIFLPAYKGTSPSKTTTESR